MTNNSPFTTTTQTDIYEAPTLCNAQWHSAVRKGTAMLTNTRITIKSYDLFRSCSVPGIKVQAVWSLSHPILSQTL
jgi:cytochrome c